ncbi:MAG: pilus assembly protein CpaF [Cryptosporangiaceae bacterium]|nr:pilus assembly protein CpaF [Cryptosporangiaceae bacterium]
MAAELTTRVRARLAAAGDQPTAAAVAAAVQAESLAPVGDVTLRRLTGRLRSELAGAGPLEPLLADPAVTDVLVNGPGAVWVDRGRGLCRVEVGLGDDESLRRLAQRLAGACGRRLDDAQPWVDGQLPDGTRLHAILPPLAGPGVCLSLRTFRQRAFTTAELVTAGTLTAESAALVTAIVQARLAFLVTGGTGSGKTTVLGALLALADPADRILIVEDAAELRPAHPHVIGLQARQTNAEGAGAVTLRDLVRQALRMRPDRIVVGECRGAEVADLLAAMNTGHEGGAGTLHANSPADVPARLEALAAAGGLGRDALHSQLAAAIHCVVHLRRGRSGRMADEVCVLVRGASGLVEAVPAWRRGGGPVPGAARLADLLRTRGADPGVLS